jgi:hypothetical protein
MLALGGHFTCHAAWEWFIVLVEGMAEDREPGGLLEHLCGGIVTAERYLMHQSILDLL